MRLRRSKLQRRRKEDQGSEEKSTDHEKGTRRGFKKIERTVSTEVQQTNIPILKSEANRRMSPLLPTRALETGWQRAGNIG